MLNKRIGLIALLVGFATTEVWAATLTNYAVGDVLVCFRKSGGGPNDLVVDAGPIANYTNASVNQRIPITQFTATQLSLVGTNAVSWSAFTWSDDTVLPASSQGTLFMTKPRNSQNIKNASGWPALSQASQDNVIVDMTTLPLGAKDNLGFKTNNIPTAIVEPDDASNSNPNYTDGQSYTVVLGPDSDFNGTFGHNPEKTTLANFTTSGVVVRSDFYQIPPTDFGDSVKYLGLFEFNTNGAMTYVAYATTPLVSTLAASPIATTTAQLNASVNPTNDNATFFFQYGLSTSYGSTSISNNIGMTSGTYGLSISNLIAATQYHFRVAAYNEYGTNFGGDLTFTTSGSSAPTVPVITYFNRTTNLTTIAYTTGSSGTYTLRGTNNLANAGARTNWPALASVAGDGLIHTNTDADISGLKFYVITAQ